MNITTRKKRLTLAKKKMVNPQQNLQPLKFHTLNNHTSRRTCCIYFYIFFGIVFSSKSYQANAIKFTLENPRRT